MAEKKFNISYKPYNPEEDLGGYLKCNMCGSPVTEEELSEDPHCVSCGNDLTIEED